MNMYSVIFDGFEPYTTIDSSSSKIEMANSSFSKIEMAISGMILCLSGFLVGVKLSNYLFPNERDDLENMIDKIQLLNQDIDSKNRDINTKDRDIKNKDRIIETKDKIIKNLKSRIQTLENIFHSHREPTDSTITSTGNKDTDTTNHLNINDNRKDLVHQARIKTLPTAIGRDEETIELMCTLLKKDKPNAILVGPPGVGKTAVVECLAHKIASGNVPDSLKNIKILMITASDFEAGCIYRGMFEERVARFIKEVEKTNGNVIIFIDEIHTLMGRFNNEPNNLPNILKPALARGSIRLIGCTTPEELDFIKKDAAFMRRMEIVQVEEPSNDSLIQIIQHKVEGYQKHHQCHYSKQSIEKAIELTKDFPGYYPDKTLTILDAVGSKHYLSNSSPEISINEIILECQIQKHRHK